MSQSTGPATVPGPRVARSRAAVLEAGVELLVEGGPNAVTVDAVVHRSGVAKTTIYRQWGSRDELLVDVIDEVVPRPPEAPADLAFEPALRLVIRTACAQSGDDRLRRAFPALLLAKAQKQPALDQLRARAQDDQRSLLEDLLQRGVAEGVIGADVTLEDAFLQLMAPPLAITCGLYDVDEGVADRIVDLFLASHRPA